jgi:hypothetical protein
MTQIYILLPIIFASTLAILALIPKIRQFFDKNTVLTNLLISIIGAYIGVFSGIYFSDYQNRQDTQEEYTKLLQAAMANVEACEVANERDFLQLEQKSMQLGFDSIADYVAQNLRMTPELAINIMSSNEMLRQLSPAGIKHITYSISNTQDFAEIVALSGDNFATQHNFAAYLKVLILFKKVLELEIQLQKNKKPKDLDLDLIYQKLLNHVMKKELEDYKELSKKSLKALNHWAKAQN